MTDAEIRAALHDVAARELSLDGPLPEGPLQQALDSVQLLTLVVGIEDRFQIELDAADEEGLETVSQVVELIARKLHGREAPGA